MGIEQYKYLATLDERTCEKCAPLDNRIFKTSERVEGMNFPTIHPNCRCTFTMSTEYARRWARDPLTGKGHKIDNMSYDEWISSMTDEQREAFEKRIKDVEIFYRRNSDREQYDRYVNVLGAENMPKTFDKFVGVKYNDDKAKYEDLKLKYSDKRIQERIRNSYNLTIHEGKQGKHILGHNNYIPGRSYLTVSIQEAQELVNKYAGMGEIQRDRKGKWTKKELAQANTVIGKAIKNNIETETSRFIIHYSKNGTHIVPTTRNFRSD